MLPCVAFGANLTEPSYVNLQQSFRGCKSWRVAQRCFYHKLVPTKHHKTSWKLKPLQQLRAVIKLQLIFFSGCSLAISFSNSACQVFLQLSNFPFQSSVFVAECTPLLIIQHSGCFSTIFQIFFVSSDAKLQVLLCCHQSSFVYCWCRLRLKSMWHIYINQSIYL